MKHCHHLWPFWTSLVLESFPIDDSIEYRFVISCPSSDWLQMDALGQPEASFQWILHLLKDQDIYKQQMLIRVTDVFQTCTCKEQDRMQFQVGQQVPDHLPFLQQASPQNQIALSRKYQFIPWVENRICVTRSDGKVVNHAQCPKWVSQIQTQKKLACLSRCLYTSPSAQTLNMREDSSKQKCVQANLTSTHK